MFGAYIVTFYWYLFQLVVLLKPGSSYCNSFALSWVDKVGTGTLGFVSVIANVANFASLDNTHLSDQVKMKLFSKSIEDLSRILRKII